MHTQRHTHVEYILQPLILHSTIICIIIFLIWYIMRLFRPVHSFPSNYISAQICSFPPSLKHIVNPSLSPHCYDCYSSSDATSQQLKTALQFSVNITSNQQHSHIQFLVFNQVFTFSNACLTSTFQPAFTTASFSELVFTTLERILAEHSWFAININTLSNCPHWSAAFHQEQAVCDIVSIYHFALALFFF